MTVSTSTTVPSTMRAAVYQAPHVVEVQDIPTPDLGADDVLVEIDFCGICGSDLHFVIEGWSAPGRVHGHEWSGRIVARGANVTAWQIGDRVVGGPTPCGQCKDCKRGRTSICRNDVITEDVAFQGAYAQFHRASARAIHRIPEGLSQRAAALTEPLAVALHGITRSGAQPGDRVLVTGAGPIGLLTVAALRARGLDDVTVSEPSGPRRDQSIRVGAARAIEPTELAPVPAMPMDVVESPYDVVIECSGRAAAMEAGLGNLAPGGSLVLSGTSMQRPDWNPLRILLLELVVTGAYNYDDGGFDDALALLASGRLPIDDLTEPDDTPLGGIVAAMERLAAGEITRKVMVIPT